MNITEFVQRSGNIISLVTDGPEKPPKVFFFFNLRKVDNSNKWKNYVIVTRVKLDALVVR